MINRTLRAFSFIFLIVFLVGINEAFAQESANHLVISQVCFNNNQVNKSWIEVYNPTDNILVLEKLRISNLKTVNVLPESIQKEGGISIGAGEYVVICADENSFISSYGSEVKSVGINALSHLSLGGFIAVTTKKSGEAKGAVVRYGKKEMSSKITELAGDQVVDFSEEGKSFIRKVVKTQTGITVSDFSESIAEPGKSNN